MPTVFGIFLAVLLDKEVRGSRFYQTALFMPVVLSLALVGFIWQLIYSRDQGLLNAVLGGSDVDWYGDSRVNLWAVLVAFGWKHTGYIMLLYLAGLKGVDPALREAAAVDGVSEVATFFRVIFPVMRPINIIVFVVVFIESLRAFDLVWIINKGRNGLELIGALVTSNIVGEASRIGFGSAMATIMLLMSLGVHHHLPARRHARGEPMSTATAVATPRSAADIKVPRKRGPRPARIALQVFLTVMALGWLFPIVWAVLNSFRDYAYTSANGYVSFGGLTLDNYMNAWQQGDFGPSFANSVIITVPAVVLTLFLACVHRLRPRPVQLPLQPHPARGVPGGQPAAAAGAARAASSSCTAEPDPRGGVRQRHHAQQLPGLIIINIAFQMGFCTFVLSNYMKTLPFEIYESAQVDGASVLRQFWQLILPLIRPALAALAVLQTTWIYNEFFWATVFIRAATSCRSPARCKNLRGQFFTDYNLLSAGCVLVAIPVLVVFFVLQKHFVAGLTLGATKG